jgi:hypothetical protein
MNLAEARLEWDLALQRFSKDIRDDFFPDPIGYRDLLDNRAATVAILREMSSGFEPSGTASLQIPKANLTLRHCINLHPLDRIVYQALIDKLIPLLDPKLSDCTFSHRLREVDSKLIFKHAPDQWRAFRHAVREAIKRDVSNYLVVTDLAQYYENIDFHKLKRHVQTMIGEDKLPEHDACVETLFKCLEQWSPYNHCGLPQNIDASSFLGNIFLDYVDRVMLRLGYQYFRYMDDIRIVVPSERRARTALIELVDVLRSIGLGLNSGKTEIQAPASPQLLKTIEEEDPEIAAIEESVRSAHLGRINAIVSPLFQKTQRFLEEGLTADSRFRFCVSRINAIRRYRNVAQPDCSRLTDGIIELLRHRPSDTDMLARYLSAAPLSLNQRAALELLIVSEPLCVYEWQNYHLWILAVQKGIRSDRLLAFAQRIVRERRMGPETDGATLYIGSCGDYADRQYIKTSFPAYQEITSRRSHYLSIQELHGGERIPFYRATSRQDRALGPLASYLNDLAAPAYAPEPPPIGIDELYDEMPDKIS